MPLLTPSEKSALEMMLRNKLGSGVGTSVMLKLFDYISESYVEPTPEVAPEAVALVAKKTTTPEELDTVTYSNDVVTPEVAAVEVTESSP